MPRDGAIIFSDLIGKLDVLYVHCSKCTRAGRYRVQHLIEERGGNAKLIDWLDEITTDYPKKQAHNMNDPCGARFPDLPRVPRFTGDRRHIRPSLPPAQWNSSNALALSLWHFNWATASHDQRPLV